jgi:hypothetical protein
MLFRRTVLTGALPRPAEEGRLDELWDVLNVVPEDRPLLIAALVASLNPKISHPIIGIFAESGAAKTTAGRIIASILDPSPAETIGPPEKPKDWVVAASGKWVVSIDNLSRIREWFSDALCRAVTGDADVRRGLFTDADIYLIKFRRIVVLNGIDLGELRGDLADRLLPLELDRISEYSRLTDEDIQERWKQSHPRILGAILDLAVECASLASIAREHFCNNPEMGLPRMADFGLILWSVDQFLGTDGFRRYREKQARMFTESLESDPFIQELIHRRLTFEGTARDLLQKFGTVRGPRGWPTTPREVTSILVRHAPALRKAGWEVSDDGGRNHKNTKIWYLNPPPTD